MYWGVPLVVRLVGEGKKWDWVNFNVVTGRGLSRFVIYMPLLYIMVSVFFKTSDHARG